MKGSGMWVRQVKTIGFHVCRLCSPGPTFSRPWTLTQTPSEKGRSLPKLVRKTILWNGNCSGLNIVLPAPDHVSRISQVVILFRNRVFEAIISWRSLDVVILNLGKALNPVVGVLIRREEEANADTEKAMWGWRQRLERCCHKPKGSRRQQKLREARKDQPLEYSERAGPRWHLDFRLLASRTVRQ